MNDNFTKLHINSNKIKHNQMSTTLKFMAINLLLAITMFFSNELTAQCDVCDDYKEAVLKPSKVKILTLNGPAAILDDKVGEMKNLQVLSLTNAEALTLPASIANLSRLTDISLQGCNLSDLPPQLYEIKSLKIINLSGNPIDENTRSEIKQKMKQLNPSTRIDF